VEPPYRPTGEIFRYVIKSKTRNTRDLLTYQNWVIERKFRSVPGIADGQTFGGSEKIYEIRINPSALMQYNLTPLQVFEAISRTNVNIGGDIIEKNNQAYVVRGVGLLSSIEDIQNIIVKSINGLPILVNNLAEVVESDLPRVGQAGLNNDDDVIEGIVVMRKGENPAEVLARVKNMVKELNEKILPGDIQLETFYDRDVLMHYCTKTVMHNVLEGIILLTAIVLLFMADWRMTVIVSIIIPLSLLFSFLMLQLRGMSASLLSLGAVDFGIIIDGTVVMVKGIFVSQSIRLNEIADVTQDNGAAFIYHDFGKRFICVKFTVRDRDLGSMINEGMKKVNKNLFLPRGYSVEWTGEFENQVRATNRLS
jgi:heavy metal efflux system protein